MPFPIFKKKKVKPGPPPMHKSLYYPVPNSFTLYPHIVSSEVPHLLGLNSRAGFDGLFLYCCLFLYSSGGIMDNICIFVSSLSLSYFAWPLSTAGCHLPLNLQPIVFSLVLSLWLSLFSYCTSVVLTCLASI